MNLPFGAKPKILLHLCCAPCSTHVVELLRKTYDPTGYFYNPNIYPPEEYLRRSAEMEDYARSIGLPLIIERYSHQAWLEEIKGWEEEPEGGQRCLICYRLRLGKTASVARGKGFVHFTTVLSISPHKDAKRINEIGHRLAQELGLTFYAADFKKRDGFKKSVAMSREAGLYRQDYCGCMFSLRDRVNRRGDS